MGGDNLTPKQTRKNRHISHYDFLENLQKEYVCMEVRSKIYPNKKDRDYYRSIANHKKEKTVSLSKNKGLPCMFDNNEHGIKIKDNIYKIVLQESGFPDFSYRDEIAKSKFYEKDLKAYFYPDSEVKISDSDEIKIGTIKQFFIDSMEVEVIERNSNSSRILSCDYVTRII